VNVSLKEPPVSESLIVRPARREDAAAWAGLRAAVAPDSGALDRALEIEQFHLLPPDLLARRLIGWRGARSVAGCALHPLGTVTALLDFIIAPDALVTDGPAFVQAVVEHVRGQGTTMITVEYPAAYSPLFTGAGFHQNTRTRMKWALGDYTPRPVHLPPGIFLRHPRPDDEEAVTRLAYHNYADTVDREMVSSSHEQAASTIGPMFQSAYSRFAYDGSFLAEDAPGQLVADILLGAMGEPEERLIWVLDISLNSAWRGRGLGKVLMGSAFNAAHAQGYVEIGLIVTCGNAPALALYHSFGFAEYGDLMYEAWLRLPG
jgi:ribosomal protein S18 acetylase RimI-like enzyme